MKETIIPIVETLSSGNNQIAVLAFLLILLLGMVLYYVMKGFNSLIDLKKEMYKAEILPDRGEKGQRY